MQVFNRIYLRKHKSSYIEIGKNFRFSSGSAINPLCRNLRGCIYTRENARIKIGDNVGISSATIWASESITIGNNVNIGGDSILMDSDAHSLDYAVRRTPEDCSKARTKPIVIGNDVLIGARTIILKGVTIGERSVIGGGSIVTKSIPSDCIAAGNPCKVIRMLR